MGPDGSETATAGAEKAAHGVHALPARDPGCAGDLPVNRFVPDAVHTSSPMAALTCIAPCHAPPNSHVASDRAISARRTTMGSAKFSMA